MDEIARRMKELVKEIMRWPNSCQIQFLKLWLKSVGRDKAHLVSAG